jgi:hypothetical protein
MLKNSCLALCLLSTPAVAATVYPSHDTTGAKDTAYLKAACNTNGVQLGAGEFFVNATIPCKVMFAENAEAFFWYQGAQPSVKITGVAGMSGTSVLKCVRAPCLFRSFEVSPPAGVDGIDLRDVQGARLLEMSVIDDRGGNSGHCVNLTNDVGDQDIFVRGGTYAHCGGWCFYSGYSSNGGAISDSEWDYVDIANCRAGGVYLYYADGMQFNGNRIQDMFGFDGVQIDHGTTYVFNGNHFNLNRNDLVLGDMDTVAISGNVSSSRGANGVMLYVNGSMSGVKWGANAFCCQPAFGVAPKGSGINGFGGSVAWGGFYESNPSYQDAGAQSALSWLVH